METKHFGNDMTVLTARFSRLTPKERLSRKAKDMCRTGNTLFKAFCRDLTDLRFFGHYCDNRCNRCFKAYVAHLESLC